MILKTGEDGSKYIRFVDYYGYSCLLREGASANEANLWLGVVNSLSGIHLTQKEVQDLLPFLQRFVETGKLE